MGRPDGEMPMRACIDRVPCDGCKLLMERGVMLVEVLPCRPAYEGGNPDDPVRTGRMWVLTVEAVQRIFAPPSLVADMLKTRIAMIEAEAAKRIGLPAPAAEPAAAAE
jgi:hypothetical protein